MSRTPPLSVWPQKARGSFTVSSASTRSTPITSPGSTTSKPPVNCRSLLSSRRSVTVSSGSATAMRKYVPAARSKGTSSTSAKSWVSPVPKGRSARCATITSFASARSSALR